MANRIVFINYDKNPQMVVFQLNEDVQLEKLSATTGTAVLVGKLIAGKNTLKIDKEDIVGFSVTTTVDLEITNTRIDVLSWSGKDPPVPPPPPLPRYANTPSFEKQFHAFIGAADASANADRQAASIATA
jgi:hypothetical protein